MSYRQIPLESLIVNRANDRHGELENETSAIAWLFNNFEPHMRNLAKDIVVTGQIFETPLVFPEDDKFIVFDGNRRVSCLKLLDKPKRAPTIELQEFFAEQRSKWQGDFPYTIQCQVETDRDRINDILLRRHTGTQGGIGQTTWDDRMKSNFINRTGMGGGFKNIAEITLLTLGVVATTKIFGNGGLNGWRTAESIAKIAIAAGATVELFHPNSKQAILKITPAEGRRVQKFAAQNKRLNKHSFQKVDNLVFDSDMRAAIVEAAQRGDDTSQKLITAFAEMLKRWSLEHLLLELADELEQEGYLDAAELLRAAHGNRSPKRQIPLIGN